MLSTAAIYAFGGRPLVHTPLGDVLGVTDEINGVSKFLGIPFAHVPERFRPAVPVSPWGKPIDASAAGPLCWQSQSMLSVRFGVAATKARFSEDCLSVNVYSPSQTLSAKPRAVMVWIHGGGFEVGGGSLYDGTQLARLEDVLVVTLNYRVGPLGFLVTEPSGRGGMNGLSDQVLALRWVQANVASFGGDADRVTVFGESAGGISVCVLSVSPLARGLFHRAIVQSGPCIDTPGWGPKPSSKGHAVAQKEVSFLGATTVVELANRSAYPPDRLASWRVMILDPERSRTETAPISVDGWVSPAPPSELWANGSAHVTAVIFGCNSVDGIIPFSAWRDWVPRDQATYKHALSSRFGAAAARVDAAYPLAMHDGQPLHAFIQLDGDQCVCCPTRRNAAIASRTLHAVYMYSFAHLFAGDQSVLAGIIDFPARANETALWASHFAEVPFVFHDLTGSSTAARGLSLEMAARWANFAKGGEPAPPSGSASPAWPKVVQDEVPTLRLQAAAVTVLPPTFKDEQCAALAERLQGPDGDCLN